ncbi:hypothetical protein B6U90_04680 [Thermoplasmatales archaeon ex4484_6]|nr:MAG: hypothetical protein B6U90_04680 [Thermoplasmatales archaeon ex4484_6]RLF69238.1 MAG: hypothetical protein DRN57_01495 [Thermoplasmata archaeon]
MRGLGVRGDMKRKMEAAGIGRITVPVLFLACLLILLSALPSGAQEEGADTDSDGMPDEWERTYGLNETDPSDALEDPDGDGLINLDEYRYRVYPFDPDSDSDGMPDGWEVEHGLDPKLYSAGNDQDGDGFTDLEEYRNGTDPEDRFDPQEGNEGTSASENAKDAASAAGALCIVLVFLAGFLIVIFLILGFYSKIRKEKLLDHETRQRMVDFIRENPGTYYSQIRRELDLPHGVVTHHLNMMEAQELIFSKQDRQFRRFYVDGLYKDTPLVTGTQKRVLDEIRRYPGSSQKEISDHLDLYPMMVSYHVGQLELLGLVEKRKKGKKNLLYPARKEKEEVRSEERIFGRGPFEGPAPEMGLVNE